MWDRLLDTAIGGILALAGTGVAQWFGFHASKVERRHQYAASQRERLERISDSVAECVEWSQQVMTATSVSAIRDMHIPKQCRQMVMLAKIYFPDLVQPATEYANSLVHYHVFALKSFSPNAPPGTTIGAQMALNPEARQYENSQLLLRNKFDEAIATEAQKYEPSA